MFTICSCYKSKLNQKVDKSNQAYCILHKCSYSSLLNVCQLWRDSYEPSVWFVRKHGTHATSPTYEPSSKQFHIYFEWPCSSWWCLVLGCKPPMSPPSQTKKTIMISFWWTCFNFCSTWMLTRVNMVLWDITLCQLWCIFTLSRYSSKQHQHASPAGCTFTC